MPAAEAGLVDAHLHVGEAMLHRLEGPDGAAELHPLLRMLHRQVHRPLGGAEEGEGGHGVKSFNNLTVSQSCKLELI